MPRRPASRRWLQMGVELEGAWDTRTATVAAKCSGAQAKGDGSVRNLPGNLGEITTRPHSILDSLCEDVATMYPDHVNESCGFHIHTSFNPLDYSSLMDHAFWDFYRDRWKAWGELMRDHERWSDHDETHFWRRFKGQGESSRQYCKAEFKPLEGYLHQSDRYFQLNFQAWHKYKTLENRMLPMFQSRDVAQLAIREWSAILDDYLNEVDFPKIAEERHIITSGDDVTEVYTHKLSSTKSWEETYKEKRLKKLDKGDDVYYDLPRARDLMLPWVTRVDSNEP